jgi:hypothetical protein
MNKQEKNKLIAKFMGVVFHDDENQYYNADGLYIGNTLQYDTSWDWLMPVVEECRLESRCEYDEDDNWNEIHWSLEECNLDKTYKAVVEFIKNQKKNSYGEEK